MRITDVNVTLGERDSYGKRVTPESLLAEMDLYHIDHAVCVHEYAQANPLEGNLLAAEAAKASGGRLGVSAVIDPVLAADCLPGEGTLTERLRAFRPESLHIYPDNNRTVFHPLYWEEVLEAADTLQLPVIIDEDYPDVFFYALPEVAREFPNARFVLVRYGLCRPRHVFPLLSKLDNVYITVEHLLDNNGLEEMARKGILNKVLFGSSFPRLSPSGALGLALYANITEEEREGILYKNWEEIKA